MSLPSRAATNYSNSPFMTVLSTSFESNFFGIFLRNFMESKVHIISKKVSHLELQLSVDKHGIAYI